MLWDLKEGIAIILVTYRVTFLPCHNISGRPKSLFNSLFHLLILIGYFPFLERACLPDFFFQLDHFFSLLTGSSLYILITSPLSDILQNLLLLYYLSFTIFL